MKIGFIGLGITGGRMAANLQKHDYSLVVFNRTRAKAEPSLDAQWRRGLGGEILCYENEKNI
jgi:3-hydroxyisobutyrate dehydrogenase-like beta-hydroxyacid dehydrogenase